jgi:hypothetical protein
MKRQAAPRAVHHLALRLRSLPTDAQADAEAQARMVGILSLPAAPGPRGVLVVTGGPQYRVGSHRQFVLLARALAARGVPVLRFDLRGMGDSESSARDYRAAAPDIAGALAQFFDAVPACAKWCCGACATAPRPPPAMRRKTPASAAWCCSTLGAQRGGPGPRHPAPLLFAAPAAGAFWRKLASAACGRAPASLRCARWRPPRARSARLPTRPRRPCCGR